jgi:hypothetical protein
VALFVVLAFAGTASAATPQKIYRDLADNGRLDGHYSQRDINRALHMPSLQRYELEASRKAVPAKPVVPVVTADKVRAIPFTSIDLALFAGVGGPLLILGAGLGRVVRLRQGEPA